MSTSPEPTVKDGNLLKLGGKKGKLFRKWQKRYCVVKDGEFSYFIDEESYEAESPQGTFSLKSAVVTQDRQAKQDYAFEITCPDRVWTFATDNNLLLGLWIAAIKENIQYATFGTVGGD